MDRTIVYPGQIPLAEQALQVQQQAYIAFAQFMNAVVGETGLWESGFDLTYTGGA